MLCCIGALAVLPPQQTVEDLNCSAHVDLYHEGYAMPADECFVCDRVVEKARCAADEVRGAVFVGERPGCSVNPYDCLACPSGTAAPRRMNLSPSSTLTFSSSCRRVEADPTVVTTVIVESLNLPGIKIVGQTPATSVLEAELPSAIGPGFRAENLTLHPVPAGGAVQSAPRCLVAQTDGAVALDNVHGPRCRTLLTARPSNPSRLTASISATVTGSSAEALMALSHVNGKFVARCTNSSNFNVIQQLSGDKPPDLTVVNCNDSIDLSSLLNVFGRHLETEMYHDGADQYPAPLATIFIPELSIAAGLLLLVTVLGHEGDILRLIHTLAGRRELHPVSHAIETTLKKEE